MIGLGVKQMKCNMKTIRTVLFWLVCLWSFSSVAFAFGVMTYPLAGEIVVTSPYGWRDHPVLGGQRYHSGLDMAAEYGQAVHAAQAGTVTLAGWVSGYGNTVIISHGAGLETLYGHNQELVVREGQSVRQGDVVALAGSTGYSTGPHCHFEVRENGVTVDPGAYLAPGGVVDGDLGSFFQSDYNFIPLDFDSYFDFAKPFREAIEIFGKTCTDGLKLIRTEVMWLFVMLLTIDFALAAFWTFFFNEDTEFVFWLLKKTLFYGALVFMVSHWGDWVLNLTREYFTSMGAAAVGSDSAEAAKILSDPTQIVQKGAQIVAPIFSHIGQFSGIEVMLHLPVIVLGLCLAFGILACYFLIGFQLMLAYLEFYLVGLLSFISMGFSGLKQTRFFAENGITAVFQVSIKLMFFCMFSLLLTNTLQNFVPTSYYTESNGKVGIEAMLEAIGRQESAGSGDYEALNPATGAYGKYQIMPENWPVWAKEAGLSEDAPKTPENQDLVARYKLLSYYEQFGNWHDVAVAWNGGAGAVGKGWTETEAYASAVLEKAGGTGESPALDVLILLRIFLASLLFVFFGNRMSKLILRIFGSGGFKFERR